MTYKSILRIPVNQEKLTKKKNKTKQILNRYELTKMFFVIFHHHKY